MKKAASSAGSAGSHGVPSTYEFYWQCRTVKCRAVHWYCPDCCKRCGKPLFRYNNPNFDGKKRK